MHYHQLKLMSWRQFPYFVSIYRLAEKQELRCLRSNITKISPGQRRSRTFKIAASQFPRGTMSPKGAAPTLQKQYMSSGTKPKKSTAEPRPSARYFSPNWISNLANIARSILLISPTNEILLLHRVRTSSSFPSAHVFPGGNLSASQDGNIPGPSDPKRHVDGPAYRLGAIRECFEESGILLAKRDDGSEGLLEVPEDVREKGRKDIHAGNIKFGEWVKSQGGVVDSGISANPRILDLILMGWQSLSFHSRAG